MSKHFNSKYYNKDHYYVVTGNRLDGFKNDSRDYVGKALLNQLKNEGIPEYKLHPVHGFTPANSKLFKEDSNKEQEEQQLKQPQETKQVFEVGDKCVIKNVDNKLYVSKELTKDFVDKEVTIMSKFEIPYVTPESGLKMVSVMNEFGQCTCFREDMCYPIKTQKEKTIEEIATIIQSFSALYETASVCVANKLYEAGYRKVGEQL